MTTAPDGTIYIADMYHGIIQESNWTRKGTYLRKKIEQFGFDKVINHGRIWRLVHDSKKPDFTKPRMLRRDAGAARRAPVARRTAGGATPRSARWCCGRTRRSCRR